MRAQSQLIIAVAALLSITSSNALPQNQSPFNTPEDVHPTSIKNNLDPLKHLSAISPFFLPVPPPAIPSGCTLKSASLLIRHSSILGNDDEFELTMEPFMKKVVKWRKQGKLDGKEKRKKFKHSKHPWDFLKHWESPIVEDNLEVLSVQGAKDAKAFGHFVRHQYDTLLPSTNNSSSSGNEEPVDHPFHVWTASSPRDITSSKSFILGLFSGPTDETGPTGEGDGKTIQLIEVPNKGEGKDWQRSLTPHKACDAFEKESSLEPAGKWLAVYGKRVRKRLRGLKGIGKWVEELEDMDILGMQMLCGYETIAQGSSPFCHLFTDQEWLDVEYYFDIRFHYMMGYGNSLSPYLGMPWVKNAAHLLAGEEEDVKKEHPPVDDELKDKKGKLPGPERPPNATHTQELHPFFTHRESPAFVATFLNLYNATSKEGPFTPPSSQPPPLDTRPENRTWLTSQIVPFLGQIALERFSCPAQDADADDDEEEDFIRVLVNGKQERMGGCDDGIEGSCEFVKWRTEWFKEREERYNGWLEVCQKKD